jgi:hypothetical protein
MKTNLSQKILPWIDIYKEMKNICHPFMVLFVKTEITGNIQATWPLDENYCPTMLILHFPNWRTISDIKIDHISWIDRMNSFLISNNCPNF